MTMEGRSEHYTWGPDDVVVNEVNPTIAARASVRQALGDAAHAMSDREIDGVIAAAHGGDDLTDDDHAEISALTAEFSGE